MANSLLCRKWIHGRCTRMKRVTLSVAKNFVCAQCHNITEGRVEPIDKLPVCDERQLQQQEQELVG